MPKGLIDNQNQKATTVRYGNQEIEVSSNFERKTPLSYNGQRKGQLDEMIGAQKQKFVGANSTAFYFQQFINWSPVGSLTTGNQVVLYAQYKGWDDSKPKDDKNFWSGSATFSVTSAAGDAATLSLVSSTGVDLSQLTDVTAPNFKGVVASGGAAPLLIKGSFTPATTTDLASFQLALSEDATIGAKARLKVGDNVNYQVGWRVFNSTTNATAFTSVDSDLQAWTLIDSATSLSAALSVAAVLFISF